jgi:hypothetical protein
LSDDVLLVDLCETLCQTLRALPYPEYERQVRAGLTELVDYHRDQLSPDVQDLAARTLRQLDPESSPTQEEIDSVAEQWKIVMEEPRPPSGNVYGLWWALSEVKIHLSSRNYVLGSDLCHALVSDVIVPVTPAMFMADPDIDPTLAIADPESPDVQMLYHLIRKARGEGD